MGYWGTVQRFSSLLELTVSCCTDGGTRHRIAMLPSRACSTRERPSCESCPVLLCVLNTTPVLFHVAPRRHVPRGPVQCRL